jgi:hypothetical protein
MFCMLLDIIGHRLYQEGKLLLFFPFYFLFSFGRERERESEGQEYTWNQDMFYLENDILSILS